MKLVLHIVICLLLTIVTQIGGVIYLVVLVLTKMKKLSFLYSFLLFTTIYLTSTFIIVPKISPLFGRIKIENTEFISYHNIFTIISNRNYVKPELNKILKDIGRQFNQKHPNIKVIYLDANFPFFDGFPLLPHLSHNDGKKIDLSFVYTDERGDLTNKKPSNSGYGVFEEPKNNEINTTNICKEKGYWQYDFTKYLTLGKNNNLTFTSSANKYLIDIILQQRQVQKIFIEPHLKDRLFLTNSKIRFHGCRAVRHDDHIHFQIQ